MNTIISHHIPVASLGIGPVNIASQGVAWAEAARHRLGIQAFSMGINGSLTNRLRGRTTLSTGPDFRLPHYRLIPTRCRKSLVQQRFAGLTHLLSEGNLPFFGDPRRSRFVDELEVHSRAGISSAVVFHGSDARDPQLSLELDEFSYFRDANPQWVDRIGSLARFNRESVADSGMETFVTTPDMLAHVPGAHLLPITINPSDWIVERPVLSTKLPRVLHNPSSPLTKGTKYIVPVLEELESQGLIEVVRSSSVPHKRMRSLYEHADIVIDSLQIGMYGVAALEAMAAGRIVVGHIPTPVRDVIGGSIPVIEATPVTLREVMMELTSDRNRMEAIAALGPAHVRRWHDGKAAADAIRRFISASVTNPHKGTIDA